MAGLPPLHHPHAKGLDRQLPSLAACAWVKGKPVFSIDVRRLRILALRRRCWVCGYPVDGPLYSVVTETDANHRYGQLHTQGSGPLHLSCAAYACGVCPFLKYPTSRRRITGDSMRGTAEIKSFNQYGLFFPPHPGIWITFGYFSPAETIPLTSLARVAELYEAAVTADAATNFTATPRLSWTDTVDDIQRLNWQWFLCFTKLQTWAQSAVTIDGHTYRGQILDESLVGV